MDHGQGRVDRTGPVAYPERTEHCICSITAEETR